MGPAKVVDASQPPPQPAGNYPNLVRRLREHWEVSSQADGIRNLLILDETPDIRPEVLAILRNMMTEISSEEEDELRSEIILTEVR